MLIRPLNLNKITLLKTGTPANIIFPLLLFSEAYCKNLKLCAVRSEDN